MYKIKKNKKQKTDCTKNYKSNEQNFIFVIVAFFENL